MADNSSKRALLLQLEQQRALLSNYQDLSVCQTDDEAYLARGNGFCDTKYSDDFINSQIVSIQLRIASLQRQLEELDAIL
ncbi:MAG: hypothetical protein KBT04_08010 [Bacteroidales bacterium]|nr:hypothetical protein [Candidatus Colimorpha onthohippi]